MKAMKPVLGDPPKPRILQILTRLGAGGPPLIVIALTREIARTGYAARLVTGQCDRSDLDMSYLLAPGDPVDFVPEMSRSVSFRDDLKALWKLVRIIRKFRPDIVHTHTAKAGALGRVAARLAGVPVVVHTFHGHVLSGYFSASKSRMVRVAERMLARITDTICVVSQQQANDMVDRFHVAPADRVRVIPLGVDMEQFRKLPPPQRKDGFLTVGWLGRFVDVKNLALLLKVVEETFRRTDRIRFVVAGDGTQRALIESIPPEWAENGRMVWLGWQQDVTGVVAQCDLLIQTSRNEGTPIALIQGMAAGRPFVSTPAGGVVDMVDGRALREENGCRWFRNGVLADPDPAVFASCLCELQSRPDEIERMGREAARFVASRHDLESFAAAYDNLYTELLARKSARAHGLRCREPIRAPGHLL